MEIPINVNQVCDGCDGCLADGRPCKLYRKVLTESVGDVIRALEVPIANTVESETVNIYDIEN